MDKMWRIKFCANGECALGFKNGRQPRLIWGDVEVEDFDFKNVCANCGDRLEVVQSVQAPTGVKRRRDSDTPDPRSVDGEESKRSRVGLDPPTRPNVAVGGRVNLSHSSFRLLPRGRRARYRGFPIRLGSHALPKPGASSVGYDLKWCLTCHWSGHNTLECEGKPFLDIEQSLNIWGPFRRDPSLMCVWSEPKHVYDLVNRSTTLQMSLPGMNEFFIARDDLLRQVLGDCELLARLQPILGDDQTARSIYETLVTEANTFTKAFVVAITQSIFIAIDTVMDDAWGKTGDENDSDFRYRVAAMFWDGATPLESLFSEDTTEILKFSLLSCWGEYLKGMEVLEKSYLVRYFSKRMLSRGERRVARLPTSYMRLEMMTEVDGKQLLLPAFKPVKIASLAEYKSDSVAHHLDSL